MKPRGKFCYGAIKTGSQRHRRSLVSSVPPHQRWIGLCRLKSSLPRQNRLAERRSATAVLRLVASEPSAAAVRFSSLKGAQCIVEARDRRSLDASAESHPADSRISQIIIEYAPLADVRDDAETVRSDARITLSRSIPGSRILRSRRAPSACPEARSSGSSSKMPASSSGRALKFLLRADSKQASGVAAR